MGKWSGKSSLTLYHLVYISISALWKPPGIGSPYCGSVWMNQPLATAFPTSTHILHNCDLRVS